MILDICFQGQAPIPRLQACEDVYKAAKDNNWLVDYPVKDDLYLFVTNDQDDHAHHIGILTLDGGDVGISGNTSADGTSSRGDRVAEHALSVPDGSITKYVHYPR